MKKVEKCLNEDCIPTPSSCVKWYGGDIPFLGICEGDNLNVLTSELVDKLEDISGDDISTFDITSLLAICEKKAPEEVTLISILTLLRDNTLCLKAFLDEIEAKMLELFANQNIDVNLRCYTNFNGLGLTITRDQLDQLVIDVLCEHQNSLDSIDTSIDRMHDEINEARLSTTVEEVTQVTCINPEDLPLSVQVQNTSRELCDLILSVGTVTNINDALANTPTDLNPEFGAIIGWNAAPVTWADYYGNTLLEVENLRQRLIEIEEVCCAVSCDDITLGFTAVMNEDGDGIIIRFTKGAGMFIPAGFEDCGSTGTVTDKLGNTQDFDIAVSTGGEEEIILTGISTVSELTVDIAVQLCNTDKGIQCNKCISGTVAQPECEFCTLTASGPVTVLYKVCTDTII